jgi:CBS domain-containing protein
MEASLRTAAERMREQRLPIVGIVEDNQLVGAISELSLASSLAHGARADDSIEGALMRQPPTIAPYQSGAEALRKFEWAGTAALLVVDDSGQLLGVLCPSDLYPHRPHTPRPLVVGGMATPFGVYLTTGGVSAGATGLPLVLTGMLLFTLFLGGYGLSIAMATWLEMANAPAAMVQLVLDAVPFLVFLVSLRSLPMAGTHASEHQVVHAIERGEELTVENVRRMPRVHPRCGTNLAVGMSLFLTLGTLTAIESPVFRLLIAAVLTLMLWRPLGSIMQQYVTTRPATERQLTASVSVGRELLQRFSEARIVTPSFWQRIWNSGILHVLLGSQLGYLVAYGIAKLAGLDLGL